MLLAQAAYKEWGREVFAPEGLVKIAQRFIAGKKSITSFQSRRDDWNDANPSFSAVPAGLESHLLMFPAINRWAIVGRPYGTKMFLNDSFVEIPQSLYAPLPHYWPKQNSFWENIRYCLLLRKPWNDWLGINGKRQSNISSIKSTNSLLKSIWKVWMILLIRKVNIIRI